VAVRLEGVDSRDAAQALTGCDVQVDRSELAPTASGEYYWHDLIGLEARNREGAELGRVEGVLEMPAHPVLSSAASASGWCRWCPRGWWRWISTRAG